MEYPSSLRQPENLEEFVFHATDRRGHCVSLRIAIPPEMDEMMNQILTRPKFPYRTKADIVRDALYHRLSWLCEHDNLGFGEQLKRYKSLDAVLKEEESCLHYEERIKRLGDILTKIGDPERCKKVIQDFLDKIYAMPEGYWKKRHLDAVKDRYSHYIEPWDMSKLGE